MSRLQLCRRDGWGSAITEMQLAHYGIEPDAIEIADLFLDPQARNALMRVSPAGPIPVLVLPNGQVMSESAAITLYRAELNGRDDLVPGPDAPRGVPALADLPGGADPSLLHLRRRPRPLSVRGAGAGRTGRGGRGAAVRTVDVAGQRRLRALVPGRTIVGAGHLCGGDDELEARPRVVSGRRAPDLVHRPGRGAAARDRPGPAAQFRLTTARPVPPGSPVRRRAGRRPARSAGPRRYDRRHWRWRWRASRSASGRPRPTPPAARRG